MIIGGFFSVWGGSKLGFNIVMNPHGYIIIYTAAISYILLGCLIWGKYFPILDNSTPLRGNKQPYFRKIYKLKDSLKKTFLLVTIFLICIIFSLMLLKLSESIENERFAFALRIIIHTLCFSYLLNWFDAALSYVHIKKLKDCD